MITYNWCIQPMAWTDHKLEDFSLDKDQCENMKCSTHNTFSSNATTVKKARKSSLRAIMSQVAVTSADESWLIRQTWLACHVLLYMTCDAMADARAFETLFSSTFHLIAAIFSVHVMTSLIAKIYLNKMGNHPVSIRRKISQLNRNIFHHHNYCFKRWKKTQKPMSSYSKFWNINMQSLAKVREHSYYLRSCALSKRQIT